VLVHKHDEHGYNRQIQYSLCMSLNNTKHPFNSLFMLCMYSVCTRIEHIHESCKDCYSTSDSRQSGCSTYTSYTHDIVKQNIMPYDVQITSGCQLSREKALYRTCTHIYCVCHVYVRVQVMYKSKMSEFHPDFLVHHRA
jgi:hypothetical protein